MRNIKFVSYLFIFLSFICQKGVLAQDSLRFVEEVNAIENRVIEKNHNQPLVIFTGSSSIRMWEDLETSFPGFNVYNLGFGGSEFSDLISHKETLIFKSEPEVLFIYEGDNDLNSGKKPDIILEEARTLLQEISERLPSTKVYLISPKPSISRWHLEAEYESLNDQLNKLTASFNKVKFIDVWLPMMDENDVVRKDLFIEDDLHMNEKGYEIWKDVIGEFLNENE